MSTCPGCDGSGWLVPAFSADVIVNCAECDDDWSKTVPPAQDVPALTERVDQMIASCERQSAEIKALLEQP